jgi:hypothetical protein
MGAGVAASPHCPFAGDTRPGRRGSPRWAVSRFGPEPGARMPILRSPSGACAPSGFPAGSPSGPKPWRFAAWQFRNRGPRSCCPADPPPKHRFRVPAGLPLAEASGLPGSPWTCILGLPVSQLPGRSSVLPEGSGPKPVSAGGSAPTCVPLSAGQESGPKSVVPSVLVRYPKVPEPGHLTMPAAFASAKGQARSIRLAAASSAARAFAPWPHCLVGQEALFAGAVAGKAFDRCRSIVSATSESCHENRVAPSGF